MLVLVLPGFVHAQSTNWDYSFGTSNAVWTSGASTTFLPAPPAGGGTARVRVGGQAGSFSLTNTGFGSKLVGVAPTGGQLNKFSIYDWAQATGQFTLSFDIEFGSGASGTWYLFTGDGIQFGNDSGFSGAASFVGLRWVYGAGGSITTSRRAAASWVNTSLPSFSQNTAYSITIYGNNSTSPVTYGETNSLAPNTWDVWVGGAKVSVGLAKAQLADAANIDSFMFYAENSVGNVATITLDNIRYANFLDTSGGAATIASFSPASGPVGTLVTINGSGFGTNPVVAFNGTPATFTSASDTQIVVPVPVGATTGKITVGTATSVTDFTVTVPGAPTLLLSTGSINNLNTTMGVPSLITNYTVTGSDLGSTNVLVTPSTPLIEIGTNGADFSGSAILTPDGGAVSNTIFLRVVATNVVTNYNATISHVSGTASSTLAVSGSITNPLPVVNVSTNSLTPFQTLTNTASAAQSFTVTASNLTADVNVSAPFGFEVANDGSSWGTNAILAQSLGSAGGTVSVRLAATNAVSARFGNVAVSSLGAVAQNVAVSGAVNETPASFSRGNLVVMRFGDGESTLSAAAVPLAVLEITEAGLTNQVINSATTGAFLLTDSGTSGSDGYLSSLGTNLALPGYNSSFGTAGVVNLNTKAVNILGVGATALGRVTFPTSGTPLPFAGSNFRSVVATDTNKFYATGNGTGGSGGVWYFDGTSFVQVSSTVTNTRNVKIFNNSLYFSTASGTGAGTGGVYQVGSGLPTSAGQVATLAIPTGSNSSPYGFSISPDSTIAYVADDSSTAGVGGIHKWTNSSGVWTRLYTFSAVPRALGVAVDFGGVDPVVYATTANTNIGSPSNTVVRLIDTGSNAVVSTIANAGANFTFRGIDFAPALPGPSITTSTNQITGLSGLLNGAGVSQSFQVVGTNLIGGITVAATDVVNFAISTNNADFTSSLTLDGTGGVVASTPVYVRLTGASAGTFTNSVSLTSSNAVARSVTVSGTVTDPNAPAINVSTNTLAGFTTARGTPSTNQTLTVTGANLGGSNITVTSSNNFYEVSTDSFATPGSNSLSLAPAGGVVAIRISANAPTTNSLLGNLALSGGGATNNVSLSGVVTNPPPFVFVSLTNLPSLTSTTNVPSAAQSFTAGGSNLTANVAVTAPAGFSLSFVESPFAASNSLILSNEFGTASNRPIWVRMNASSVTNILGPTNIVLSSAGASNRTVSVSGTITAASPSLTATPPSLTNFFAIAGSPSAAASYILSGSNLSSPVSVAAPAGFEVALTNTNAAFSSSVAPAVAGGLLNTNIWVRVSAAAATNTNLTGAVTNTSGTALTNVVLQARVVPAPTMSAVPSALSNFTTITGIASTNQSFNLTASNLLGPVTMTVTNGYEISTSTNSGFTTNLTIALTNGSDVASNYTTATWTNGANGGTGFGPWSLPGANGGTGFNGAFIGPATNTLTNYAPLYTGGVAFSIYAGGAGSAYQDADRTLSRPLAVGETLTHSFGIAFDNGNKGFDLYSGTNQVFNFNVNSSGYTWTGGNSSPPTPYTTNREFGAVINFAFTRTTNGFTYAISSPQDANLSRTGSLTNGGIDRLKYYISGAGGGDPGNIYFNNFQVSYTNGTISNLPVYVRLAANAPVAEAPNSLLSRVTISSTNATDVFVDLSGNVEDRPSVSAVPGAISNLITTNGYASAPTNFTVTGRNLSNNVTLTVTPTNDSNFEISTNGFSWTNFLSFVPTDRLVSNNVLVRITQLAPVSGPNELAGFVTVRTGGALSATNVSLLGTVLVDSNIPTVSASTYALSGLGSVESSPGPSTNFSVSGTFLRGPITVTAGNSFLAVSADNTNFGASVSLPRGANNDISNTPVYVRITEFAPVSTNTNAFLGNLLLDTTRNSNNLPAATNIAVSGTVTNWSVANPFGIRVTNPSAGLSTEASSFLYRGQIGSALSGGVLRWLNVNSEQSNFFTEGTNWTWSASVPLVSGNNMVTFSGQYVVNAGPTNVAFDSPADEAYANGWGSGDSGGDGFGPWQLVSEEGLSRLYIANIWDGISTNMNVSGFYGFALEAIVGGSATAYRPFLENMQAPGGSFAVYFDSNDVQPGGSVGLHLVDSNRVPLFTFAAANDGSGPQFTITDVAGSRSAGWTYSSTGFLLQFSMAETNRYELTATATNAGVATTNTNGGLISAASPISGVVFFDDSSGAPAAHNFYVGAMQQSRTLYRMETAETVAPDVERLGNPGSAYDLWAQGFGLDPSGNGSPGADPDMDSFSNELEYAFGTSPIAPDASLLDVEHDGASVFVSYVARKSGVAYALLQKSDLADQVPGWADSGRVPSVDTDQTGVLNPDEYVRMIFSAPAAGSRDFYRVRATITE
jgi:hypothetical protein